MTKKINKKLTLKKETVALLSDDMNKLKGGILPTGCVVSACCASNDAIKVCASDAYKTCYNCPADTVDLVACTWM